MSGDKLWYLGQVISVCLGVLVAIEYSWVAGLVTLYVLGVLVDIRSK